MYELRNDLLHGNPLESGCLTIANGGLTYEPFRYAAPSYRLGLTNFLDLKFDRPVPSLCDPEALGRHVAEKMEFEKHQKQIEAALIARESTSPSEYTRTLPPPACRDMIAASRRRVD